MHGPASAAPAMTDRGARAPSPGHDKLQVFGVFDGGDEEIIIIGVNIYRECQGPFPPPIAAILQITHLTAGDLT